MQNSSRNSGSNATSPQPRPVSTRPLSTGRKLAFSVALLLVALAAVEIACRALGLGRQEKIDGTISQWHETPDGRVFWVTRGPGFNSDGLRDVEHEKAKPPGRFRFICLGDSVTRGHGVPRESTYPYALQSFLTQLGVDAEVFNVATSGWATLQELAAYETIARPYQPDHVFLGFCLNDVAEMHNNLREPPPAVVAAAMRHSAFVRWLAGGQRRQISNVRQLFTDPTAPAVEDGWRRVLDALDRLHEATRADGCELSVLIFPFRFQVEPDAPQPTPQRRLFEHCLRAGIPCFDMLPVLRPLGSAAFIDDSHLSAAGAAAVAEALVNWGRTGCRMCGLDLSAITATTCPRCHTGRE